MKQSRQRAERRLAKLADEHGVADRAEKRVAVGEPASLLGQIAAEEAADVIVVGARARGLRKRLESRLADELENETPVPVLIAAPRTGRGRKETEEGANVVL
jgi:nucleotide-binding universal stress UspA family protein